MPANRPEARLSELSHRGCTFLGSSYPVMGGAMTWVSERNLVAAISNAGGFGVIASGAMTPEQLDAELAATQALTDRPFGVNLITMHPQLGELIDICLARGIGHIVLAGGIPQRGDIKRIREAGVKVICFAPSLALARKLVRAGADALVIEGSEAGGHTGPVSTSVLAQEILPNIHDVPVFVAGGIGRGEAMLSYMEMGAAGVQLGTRFVPAHESIAHPSFKQAFLRAGARDATLSVQLDSRFPVIPVRALANEGTQKFMETQREVIQRYNAGELDYKTGQLEIERFWAGALRRAVIDGDVTTGSLMAGQSVALVTKEQPVADILAELWEQARAALAARADAAPVEAASP